jgi:uncharacterized protein (DUF2062 family)
MPRSSLSKYWNRIRSELRSAFQEEHTPHEVAGSFSIGVFVAVLPSLGLGLVLFLYLSRVSDRISSIAIFSSALVINPLVKAPMYVAAFWIGTWAFGPVGVTVGASLADAVAVAVRMVSGFVVIAFVTAAIGYAVVYVLVTEHRKRDVEIVEEVVDDELLPE